MTMSFMTDSTGGGATVLLVITVGRSRLISRDVHDLKKAKTD